MITSAEFRAMHARQHQAEVSKSPAGRFKPARAPQATPKPPQQTTTSAAPIEGRTGQEMTFAGWLPGSNGPKGLLRMGWRNRQRLAQYCDWEVAAARLRPMAGPVRLELVRYSTGGRLDFDNLVSTGKYPIDALVRCGILPDDNPTVIAERVYTQEKAESKASQRTVIRLIAL